MTSLVKTTSLLSRIWEILRAVAREVNTALAGPARTDADREARERAESVFQPRQY